MLIVKSHLTCVFRCGSVTLMPGNNQIKESDWDAVKEHPIMKMRLDRGDFTLNDLKKATDATDGGARLKKRESAQTLSDLNVKEACDLIADTYDRETLLRWADEDKRKTVDLAIDAQLKKISLLPKEEEKENEKDDA